MMSALLFGSGANAHGLDIVPDELLEHKLHHQYDFTFVTFLQVRSRRCQCWVVICLITRSDSLEVLVETQRTHQLVPRVLAFVGLVVISHKVHHVVVDACEQVVDGADVAEHVVVGHGVVLGVLRARLRAR